MACFCLPLEAYYILLSSITNITLRIIIFEDWKQVVSKK